MMKLIKTLIICFTSCLFCLAIFSPAWSGKGDIDLKFKGRTFSAHLRDVPLKVILEKLEREKGIWFKGGSSLLEEKVSVQFTDLSLQEGLNRIFASTNYAIMFDREKRVVGVIILGWSSTVAQGMNREKRVFDNDKLLSSEILEAKLAGAGTFEIVRNSPPPGNPNVEPIDMKIVKNCPPPENPDATFIDTTVVKNCPPPGNPDVLPIDMTIIKNCLPPGS